MTGPTREEQLPSNLKENFDKAGLRDGSPLRVKSAQGETNSNTRFFSSRYNEQNVEERLELTFHGRNSGLWERDILTDQMWFSAQFFGMLGYLPGELPEYYCAFEKLIHPQDKEKTLDGLKIHLQSSEPYRIHYRLNTKLKGYRWYEAVGFAYKNEFDLPVKLTGSITDIHDMKVEEIARQCVYDVQISDQMKPDEKIQALLKIGIDLFDVESAFVANARPWYRELLYVEGNPIIGEVGDKFRTNKSIEYLRTSERDVLLIHDIKDLNLHPLKNCLLHHLVADYIGVPFSVNGKKFGFVSFLSQTKRLKPYSAREIAFAKTLSQCISYELGRQAYVNELKASNAELERFAYVASHDLQEPLRKISTCCGLLEEQLSDIASEDTKQLLEITKNSSKRMRSLISDILELSSIDQIEENIRTLKLSSCLADTISDLDQLIQRKGAKIEIGDLPTVMANRSHMTILFQNLISNSLKFNDSVQPVVTLQSKIDDGFHRISVTDNGIGIAPEYRTKVFEVFQRLHNRSRYPGTGIGLAIARRVVDLYGGNIWISANETAAKNGTTVFVTLPIMQKG